MKRRISILLGLSLVVSFAIASRVLGGAAPLHQKRPELEILSLAYRIWYPVHKKPDVRRLVRALRNQSNQDDWQTAIETAKRLTGMIPESRPHYEWDQPWEWRAAIADLYIYSGQPKKAATELRQILAEVPGRSNAPALLPVRTRGRLRGRGEGNSAARQSAAYSMARAKAEVGDFKSAITWLKRAPDEYWSGCGNCMAAEEAWAHPILAVWSKAQLPYEQAVTALGAIIEGGYGPMRKSLSAVDESAKVQKRHVRDEAALILGELHARDGDVVNARKAFAIAAQSEFDIAFIAQTHLKQLH